MEEVTFFVPGTPVAKGRPRLTTINGMARAYTPKKTANYESLVAMTAQQAMAGRPLLRGPLHLTYTAFFPIPKSWTKKRLAAHAITPEYVTKRPDRDNIEKALGDGMNGVVFEDDSQIADGGRCRKLYGEPPGLWVQVREILPQPDVVAAPPAPSPVRAPARVSAPRTAADDAAEFGTFGSMEAMVAARKAKP